tara:strand:- start:7613 stop:8128 length:516 start_codon:yes stop_codon:yes gene_type:complete
MRITISEETKIKVWNFLKENNIANRGIADGTKQQQYIGMLGEYCVKRFFKVDTEFSKGFDGGFDLEYNDQKIDVKTMGRNVDMKPDYVHNFSGLQKHFKCDLYIFTSLNKKTSDLTICGWVTKEELFERSEKFKKGTKRYRTNGTFTLLKCTTYEIKNKDLNPINDLITKI